MSITSSFAAAIAVAVALIAAPAAAETIGGNPGPAYNYICPEADGRPALDCYFDAVAHLYTMCKHVKSIEIIEFGYENATEGTHGAKSDSCVVKQKQNMTKPYQAALHQAAISKQASDARSQPAGLLARRVVRPRMAQGRVGRGIQGAHDGALREVQGAHRRHQGDHGHRDRPDHACAGGAQGAREGQTLSHVVAESPEHALSGADPALGAIFGDGGALARALTGFRFRPQQLEMADAVARAIAERQPLLAEAGTGTGKTFAYLVPALLYGGKVIVSTGTKTLQDQLFQRDLPLVRAALGAPVTLALLKGRANYVCHHHLEQRGGRGPAAVAR